jgi:Leucine-rich repeat (LRR) protein
MPAKKKSATKRTAAKQTATKKQSVLPAPRSDDRVWTALVQWANAGRDVIFRHGSGPASALENDGNLARIDALYVKGASSLEMVPLEKMPLLTRLVAHGDVSGRLKSLAGLERAAALTHVDFEENEIEDVTALGSLPHVSDVILAKNAVRDISSLASCAKLEYVNLRGNPIVDVSPLFGAPKLKQLWLSDTKVRDVMELTKLKKLKILTVPASCKKQIGAFRAAAPNVRVS